ncbi:MAG: 8-oxo-dGTP diphosphatase [Verrucomicrobiales bacterium]|jgi:8-oxo-dGTP diphosphatase
MTDWTDWEPNIRANLLFLLRGDEVLLIRKKRGIGAGKINAPGGKIEPGETAEQGAIRETIEEVGLTATNLSEMGELHFQFVDGMALHCTVFHSEFFEGEAIETDEAIPIWTKIADIPYDEMWEDDIHWLPRALAGEIFRGYFEFDDDKMLSQQLEFTTRS